MTPLLPSPSVPDFTDYLRGLVLRQTAHPVMPPIEVLNVERATPESVLIRYGTMMEEMHLSDFEQRLRAREDRIAQSQTDPLRWIFEAPIWQETDLRMALKRLEHPGVVLRILVTGGIRSAKTEGCTRRVMANFLYTKNAKVWATHETQTTSQAWQHPRVFRFLPPELQPGTGKLKKDITTKFNYGEGTGFAGDKFNLRWECHDERGQSFTGGGLWEFRFFKSDISTFQGAELTCGTSDELVPLNIMETIDERLNSRAGETRHPDFLKRIREAVQILETGRPLPLPLLAAVYHGVHLLSFTPKEGWSETVANMLEGASTLMEVPADPELLPGKMVPRFKQPMKPQHLVAYLHTYDNPFMGNWEGLRESLKGKPESEIRITGYGDVTKNWSVEFMPPFDPLHHVIRNRDLIPGVGTLRLVIDPARARPWFMGFFITDSLRRRYLVREWPQRGSDVPGQGDPGDWTVSSRRNKINGDPGPAQQMKLGWGFDHYTREILRVLMEIGRWWLPAAEREARRVTIKWERYPDWTLEGSPAPLHETLIDPRFAVTGSAVASGEQDYIQGMESALDAFTIDGTGRGEAERIHQALIPFPAPGKDIETGDGLIIDALGKYNPKEFNPDLPNPMNCPDFRIWHECAAAIFTMQMFSIAPFRSDTKRDDEACKDPRDVIAMHELAGPVHVDLTKPRGFHGGFYF